MKTALLKILITTALLIYAGCDSTGNSTSGASSGITFGPSVSTSATNSVASIISAAGEVPADKSGGSVPVTVNSTDSVVFALNADGDALLAGFAPPGGKVMLDYESTALVLVRTFLLPTLFSLPDESVLRAQISSQPGFTGLVTALESNGLAGLPYSLSTTIAQQASDIADSIASSLPLQNTPAKIQTSNNVLAAATNVKFTNYPLITVSSSFAGPLFTTLTFYSDMFTAVGFSITPTQTTVDSLNGKSFCPTCLPPTVGFLPIATDITNVMDGQVSATVDLGTKQKKDLAISFAFDLLSGILRFAAVQIPDAAVKSGITTLQTVLKLDAAALQGSLSSALSAIANALWENRLQCFAVFAQYVDGPVANRLFKVILNPIIIAKNASWAADKLLRYSDVATVWNAGPDTLTLCVTQGTFSQCPINLAGNYVCSKFCPSVGIGETSSITQSGANVILINASGATANGVISGNLINGTSTEWGVSSFTVTIGIGPNASNVNVPVLTFNPGGSVWTHT